MSSTDKSDYTIPQKAGFIPYVMRGSEPLFYFMVPSDPAYGGTRPSIAKGNIDPGESEQIAGIREAAEELGLKAENIKSQFHVWAGITGSYYNRYSLSIYAGEVYSKEDFNEPHYETGETFWLTLQEFEILGKKSHIGIVQCAYTSIKSNQLNNTQHCSLQIQS